MRQRVVIIEPSVAAAQRIARAGTVANDMVEAIVVDSVVAALEQQPTVLGYNAVFADDIVNNAVLRGLPSVIWSTQDSASLMQQAASSAGESMVAWLGWPTYMVAPRAWELLIAFRNALAAGLTSRRVAPTAQQLLSPGASVIDWRVSSTTDRDDTIAQVTRFAQSVAGKQTERIAGVTHELLMNALYDAPVAPDGKYLYAHDRNADIQLLPEQSATCRVASDGQLLVIEVVDPFGGLRRSVVLRTLSRVIAAARLASGAQVAIDTSHGGAGLGLHRVFTAAAATLIQVIPRHETRVCACFDLTLSARDLRGVPGSLHYYKGNPT
jgi:hypothetical protein